MNHRNNLCRAPTAVLSERQLNAWLRTPHEFSSESELARVMQELRGNPPAITQTSDSTLDEVHGAFAKNVPPSECPPTSPDLDLDSLGAYRVLHELGRGATGIVLLACDERLGRNVAIKVLRPDRNDRTNRQRFVREARAAAGLNREPRTLRSGS